MSDIYSIFFGREQTHYTMGNLNSKDQLSPAAKGQSEAVPYSPPTFLTPTDHELAKNPSGNNPYAGGMGKGARGRVDAVGQSQPKLEHVSLNMLAPLAAFQGKMMLPATDVTNNEK